MLPSACASKFDARVLNTPVRNRKSLFNGARSDCVPCDAEFAQLQRILASDSSSSRRLSVQHNFLLTHRTGDTRISYVAYRARKICLTAADSM